MALRLPLCFLPRSPASLVAAAATLLQRRHLASGVDSQGADTVPVVTRFTPYLKIISKCVATGPLENWAHVRRRPRSREAPSPRATPSGKRPAAGVARWGGRAGP
ncbi:Protein of unknown function [Gryllus bimaculatus]|nr:Protein of unknown function [Gryllus bimaculatus]